MSGMFVDVPHNLGVAEARRRIESGTGKLVGRLPAGAKATPRWSGDKLHLDIVALGQEMTADLDVQETLVRVQLVLPAALSFLRPMIETGIHRAGTELLQDKRPR